MQTQVQIQQDLDFVHELSAIELPNTDQAVKEVAQLSAQITLGRSAFLQYVDCGSEYEYKRQCMSEGRIMYHAHIGMNDVQATVQALCYLESIAEQQGFRIDRAGVALDRRMGLPPNRRESAPAETGPMLVDDRSWYQLSQCAKIQPHMGDFMIGQPASVTNTVLALNAGATTIGNLSQYFSFEAPGWTDKRYTSIETMKAIALLAKFKERGVMLHSYLEDGYGALFQDCVTVAGWAYLEKYIVQDLLGARLSHCIGGLTSDPVKRAGWVFALNQIHDNDAAGSMIYGDTISFTQDFDHNRGLVSEYLLWDILAQLHQPSGHAVLPLPVTEAIRIPSGEEIAEAQCFGRRVEQTARRLLPHVDFSAAERFASEISDKGKIVFENALAGLAEYGVNVKDPLVLLHSLKAMGPVRFERLFGAGDIDEASSHGRRACIPTDIFQQSLQVIEEHRGLFENQIRRKAISGKKLLLASSDVHEHAIYALGQLLSEAGANVINLGPERNPEDIAQIAKQREVDVILLSTHNGNALEYARQLKTCLQVKACSASVVLGGVLNQKVDDQVLPIPVADDIKQLGFQPVTSLPSLPRLLG